MEERSNTEIEGRIKRILISDVGIEPDQLAGSDAGTPLLGRGIGLDSMEALTLAAGIEREFRVEIGDDELTPDIFETIGSLVEYVSRKTSTADPIQKRNSHEYNH